MSPFANPETKVAYDAARYAANRDKVKEKVSEYYQANREARLAKQKEWVARHAEHVAERERKKRERCAVQRREYVNHRKALIRGASSGQRINVKDIYERDGWVCGICHQAVTLGQESIDHIIPVSKGGSHTPDNVRLAHLACNIRRGNRL